MHLAKITSLQSGYVANMLSVTTKPYGSGQVSEVRCSMTEETVNMQYDSTWLQEADVQRLSRS